MPYSPGILDEFEEDAVKRINDFNDPRQEWRRLIAEFVATFFLVLVAAGHELGSRIKGAELAHERAENAEAEVQEAATIRHIYIVYWN